ncbi:hypothetical protein [Nocardioides sp. B-3]|uniref:hypothetical protein n=1 Tax=Nocardioides sp. B-3 TaxID=2895565 RepID=UPI002152ABAC|nr:hypothetical protein [Nocardioides sp. B-3]UUZ60360.1 hypothetical protein LP418_05475 [Nocardioides sp. B-3]
MLVIVDDLQWLDPESAAAIVFAARRLGPDAVAFLLAAREGTVPDELTRGLPLMPVTGLSTSAAATILPAQAAPAVVASPVAATQGNPLAPVELVARLDDAQWLGAAELPDPLPAGDRLREHFGSTVDELSPAARSAVLHLALVGEAGADTHGVVVAPAAAGIDAGEALAEACRRGVLVEERVGHRFRHPLLRSTVLELATPGERRSAHAALAAALPESDRTRLWHRAESATGKDSMLAGQLVTLAGSDRDRLGFAAAATALERAAELTPEPALARQRLALAAHDAFRAGDVVRVRALVGRVPADGVRDRSRGDALFTLGMLEQYAGSVPHSVEYYDEASYLLDGSAPVRDLTELALARFRLNDMAGMADCARRIDEVADPDDAEQQLMAAFCGGAASVMAGDFEAGMARLDVVRRLADLPELRHDAQALLLMAPASAFTGQVGHVVTVGAARLTEVRRRGAIGVLVPCPALLASGRARLGDHTGAFADAGEAADPAEHLGYAADASVAVEMLARQSAARGLHDDAGRSLARARELTDRAGTTAHAAHQAITAAFCALCRGDLGEVVTLLEARLAADGGVGASGEPLGVAPLLVEAYLGPGRTEDARSLAAGLAEANPPGSPALWVALARRCEALTVVDEEAAAVTMAAAMTAHAEGPEPFEAARTRLLYGGRLRRSGRRVAAREHLAAAHGAFVEMDLTYWVAVAEQELAATGADCAATTFHGQRALDLPGRRGSRSMPRKGCPTRRSEPRCSSARGPSSATSPTCSCKRGVRSRTELAATYRGLPSRWGRPQRRVTRCSTLAQSSPSAGGRAGRGGRLGVGDALGGPQPHEAPVVEGAAAAVALVVACHVAGVAPQQGRDRLRVALPAGRHDGQRLPGRTRGSAGPWHSGRRPARCPRSPAASSRCRRR